MSHLKIRYKIFPLLLLGAITISLLILPPITINPIYITESNCLIQDSLTEDNIAPHAAAPGPDLIYSKTYNITQSEDDAWNRPNPLPRTTYVSETLLLGGHQNANNNDTRRLLLRWNLTEIPEKVRIINAYISLTVESTTNYGGIQTTISAFDSNEMPAFNDTSLDYWNLPQTSEIAWNPPASLSTNQTIQTSDITSLVQYIVDLENWNEIFAVVIRPSGAVTAPTEMIEFWSFDHGNLTHTPKLYIEWEESPHFLDVPADFIMQNETLGYHLNWTAQDNNPTTYTIIGNETLGGSMVQVQNGTWFSEETIRYDIPKIDIESQPFFIINYTITVYDGDGNYEWDSIIVNVTDKDLPVLGDIKFIQDGVAFTYPNRKFLDTNKGPFTMQIYNKTPIDPTVKLKAFYPENHITLYTILLILGMVEAQGIIHIQEWTTYTSGSATVPYEIWFTDLLTVTPGHTPIFTADVFNYSDELGCWQLTPEAGDRNNGLGATNYTWTLVVELVGIPTGLWIFEDYDMPVQDIIYDLTNYFTIDINGGAEFIYNQTVYSGGWPELVLDLENKDISAPTYNEPKFVNPEKPDHHYEVSIRVFTEKRGAEVDEVFLFYKIDDGAWEKTEMVYLEAKGKFYGEIPPQTAGAKITYYIQIFDIAGNNVKTDEFRETAVTFEEPSPVIPIVGILIAILGALSIVVVYRIKHRREFRVPITEKISKKSVSDTKRANKLFTKIKKVRKKWSG